MSIRIVFVMLVAAVSMAFGFMPANVQQPQRAQPPQSLRLYVLDCGKITPANADAYGLKSNEMATVNMITPCFLIVHPRGTMIWDTGEISDSAFKDGVSPQKLNTFTVDRPLLPHVFGDGTVVIKSTPGHTPGHQSLFLKLGKTGNVLLTGDLYHYPEEITLKKIPSFDTNKEQTAKSREMIEEFVKQNRAQLWIQHDYTSGIKRKVAPEFYD